MGSKAKRPGIKRKQTVIKTTKAPDGGMPIRMAKQPALFKPALEALIITLFAIGVYINTLNHGFVLDDMMMITHNEFTKEGFDGLGKILTNDAFTGFHGENKNLLPGGRYRPLSQLMFAVEYGIFGENPFPGHLVNILLYALACMLLYKALVLLFETKPQQLWRFSLPFIITLLFALHPLHTESVANIKGRDEILTLAGFALLSAFALRYRSLVGWRYLLGIVMVFFLSMLAKESSLTFLAAIPLLMWYRHQEFSRSMLHVFLAMLGGLALYLTLRIGVIGIPKGAVSNTELLNDPFLLATGSERIATLFYTWLKYLQLILFPHPLTHDYYPWHIAYKSFSHPAVILFIILFAGLALYVFRKLRKPDIIAAGILLFAILFSSQSNLLVNIGSFMNERFVFIALLGILFILAWLLVKWLPRVLKGDMSLSLVILGLIVAGYTLATVKRNQAWKDDFTLFTTDVKVSANSAKVNVSAGGSLLERAMKMEDVALKKSMLEEAITYLRKGTELHPRYVQGQILLGNAEMSRNHFIASMDAYEACLKMNPAMEDVVNNAGVLGRRAFQSKDYPSTEEIYRRLLKYQPGNMEFASGYAEALLYNRKFDEVQPILDSLMILDPDNSNLNHLMGQLWGRYKAFIPGIPRDLHLQYLGKARSYLLKAVEGEPENYGILENLAIVHGLSGDLPKALSLFHEALEMMIKKEKAHSGDPLSKRLFRENMYRLYRNIGDTYGNLGDEVNLLKNYEEAYKNNPDDGVLVSTMSKVYYRRGNRDRGIELLRDYLVRHPEDQQVLSLLQQIQGQITRPG